MKQLMLAQDVAFMATSKTQYSAGNVVKNSNIKNVTMWVWSKLSASKWEDAWEERFYDNPNLVISEFANRKKIRLELFCKNEKDAEGIKAQFGGSVRKISNKNWVAHSTLPSPPIRIRKSLVLSGTSDEGARNELIKKFPGRKIIQIPADMAFGTGSHETTSTCLRFLVDVAQERKDTSWEMLDLGCGSGVLAIAARMLGANTCFGIDYDSKAVHVAKRNVIRNKQSKIQIIQQDLLAWKAKKSYSLVVANLYSTILQNGFPRIVKSMKKNADLIVSGVLHDQWPSTSTIATTCGLEFTQVKKKGKWVTARGIIAS